MPIVLVVPFCCVAGVALLAVVPGVGVMPGDGVMPWFGVMPCVGVIPFVGDVVVLPGIVDWVCVAPDCVVVPGCGVVPVVPVVCAAAKPMVRASTGTAKNSFLIRCLLSICVFFDGYVVGWNAAEVLLPRLRHFDHSRENAGYSCGVAGLWFLRGVEVIFF